MRLIVSPSCNTSNQLVPSFIRLSGFTIAVTFDENGKIGGLSSQLQNAPYNILSDKDCRKKTKNYKVLRDSNRKYVNNDKVICAAEENYKDKKVAGRKTKLCYVCMY